MIKIQNLEQYYSVRIKDILSFCIDEKLYLNSKKYFNSKFLENHPVL